MLTKLNLASRPFRNRTTPFLLALVMVSLALAAALLSFAKLRRYTAENERAKAEIAQMEAEAVQLRGKGEELQQQLTPQQKDLLVAAHKLVASKSFVWSRLFSDLEAVLPGSVSASRISVQNIYKDGDRLKAELDLGVLSRDYQSVMNMIAAMNASGMFQAELRGQDLQSSERATFSEYTLRVIYTPPYGVAAADLARNAGEGNR